MAGMVQGVVVQMTTVAPFSGASFTTGNFTHTVGLTWSWYSTSASASAVRSTGLHMTGLEPRYSWPDMRNLWNSRTMVASEA